jgi:cytochrome c oxidase subunit 2
MEYPEFHLFPEQASTHAGPVDAVYFYIVLVSLAFSVVTAVLLITFAVKYRRRPGNEQPPQERGTGHASVRMELFWCGGLLLLFLSMFFWSAHVYLRMMRPPDDATEVYVVGRQWMWKVQHPDGQREINELHVQVGQPTKLIMTSEDVIHSFYIPAFRIKQDAVPGRYTYMWFQATKPGRYHLFCAEYCGTHHSRMRGTIVALEPSEYQEWLNSTKADLSMANRGRQLFLKLQCVACHTPGGQQRAPSLENLFMREVPLADGGTVVANEDYIRESIRFPKAKIVAGHAPIMPAYTEEQLSAEELNWIVAWIKGLKTGETPTRNERTAPPPTNPEEERRP